MLAHNKFVVAVLAVLIAGSAWFMLSGGSGEQSALITEDFAAPSSQADRDLVATLLQLRSVSLDGTIFSDPVFQSLRDFGSQIIPEPVGRQNPFAPLQGASVGGAAEKSDPKTAPKTAPKTGPGTPKQ